MSVIVSLILMGAAVGLMTFAIYMWATRPKTELDKAWENCIAMWIWIADNFDPDHDADAFGVRTIDYVQSLKLRYIKDRGLEGILTLYNHLCFFCAYRNDTLGDWEIGDTVPERCQAGCPGAIAEPGWMCTNMQWAWHDDPVAFLAKLKELDAMRKGEDVT